MWAPSPMLAGLRATVKPEDVPPPTPISLPTPVHIPDEGTVSQLSSFLQAIHRPIDLEPTHLGALGLRVSTDANAEQLVPDPDFLPDFSHWETLSLDEAHDRNDSTRRPLCNNNRSPGCLTYFERKKELSYVNRDAFRTVRRLPHAKSANIPRLGVSYDFWRSLEALTAFWDDPTDPPPAPPAPAGNDNATSDPASASAPSGEEDPSLWRTGNAENIPPNCLHNLAAAFVKLVTYEFGCTVQHARTEPRLSIVAPPAHPGGSRRCSSIASGCIFVSRSPTTRATARAGIVDGPLAAVSVRSTISFETEFDSTLDLAREVIAALLTAQHRAREGRTERRFGEGEWWSTKARWGGGPGGPIGREVDKYDIAGDKDAAPGSAIDGSVGGSGGNIGAAGAAPPHAIPPRSGRSRKNLSIYDNYRAVRPPAASWDSRMRYEAIGKAKGSGHDDVFVFSMVCHHVSIVRFRVPEGLLEVLDGAPEDGSDPWGGLQVWRSPWFDLFVREDRLAAYRILWGIMAYAMRKQETEEDDHGEKDVEMAGA